MKQRTIPQRELRNRIGEVLREVEAGARIRVTVRGRPVAELVPVEPRQTWAPWESVERIRAEAPLDPGLRSEIVEALGDSLADDPWERYGYGRS
jgi:prevent-host-death family protein